MKSRIGLIAAFVGAMSFAASPAYAAFASLGKSTVTATVTTGGSPTVTVDVKIRLVTSPEGADQTNVQWSGVTPGTTEWKIADRLLRLNSTITNLNGGAQIYTDNTQAGASPQFVDPTPGNTINPDSNPAGLVSVNDTGKTLPIAWSIKDSSKNVEGAGAAGIRAANPNHNGSCSNPTDADAFQWLFMLDSATPAIDRNGDGDTNDTDPVADCPEPDTIAFANGNLFSTMLNKNGFHFGQADSEFGGSPTGIRYVYLQADFTTSFAAQQYTTNRLIVETFTL